MNPSPLRDEAVWSSASSPYRGFAPAKEKRSFTAYGVMKRTMDIGGSLAGLLALSPLITMVALLIKLEDPKGPVFFQQTRIGKDGKPFRMYKLRSMSVNAEEKLKELLDKNEINGAMFKMKDDPRITKVGKFIRKTSIDELPQLLNVLKGNMSLVGPRPPLEREVTEYSDYDKQRLMVTPGCTGLWQVSGRNSLSFHEMVELDIKYIQKKCIWLDIKIMLRTVKAIIAPQDAF
ncbi:sugar transferase [Paenibacillus sp. PAMC21692]|uniref:sugar transferase n=1 Tax=Paenibacillus sp. PAMC21692 TaxID=2762320 RepID=UPI00164DB4F9|nr:sugar transferase [Paenibacillus sp. PAMC21692]QNK55278.1 sugar transferase [Paenibacillus sp. PAMC21692]